ncbi:MAG: radical SAM protein [bacterium]|nr:MAG: radical SAM protein [bacterium]
MELFVTARCNLHCPYCFVRNKRDRDMSWETATSALDYFLRECGQAQHLTILFFGGEPMLRMDFIKEFVPYALDRVGQTGKSLSFDMTTNGTLLDVDSARFFARYKIKYLLSIDGLKEDHDRYRSFSDGSGSWDLIVNLLPMLKRYQPWQGARMTPSPESSSRIVDGVKVLYERGINQFIIGSAHGMHWPPESIRAYFEQMQALSDLYIDMKLENKPFRLTIFERGNLEEEADKYMNMWGCGAGRGRLCVNFDGTLYGCSKLMTITGDNTGLLPLGSLQEGWTNALNRSVLNDASLRYRIKCRDCKLGNECVGGCPAINWEETGHVLMCGPYHRAFTALYQKLGDYFYNRWIEKTGKPPPQ